MKMLEQNEYQEIRAWVHRNARPLELALWNFYFEEGRKEDVVNALAYYQNTDGGFGNGLDPDCWNYDSSPYATLVAIGLLRQIGFMEDAGTSHPMLQGIFRFLDSGVHKEEDGWLFSIPSNDAFPRAPWNSYDEGTNKLQAMGITAGLCSFLLLWGEQDSQLYQKAVEETKLLFQKAASAEDFGEMGAGGIYLLLEDVSQSGISSLFALDGLAERITQVIHSSIERNTEKWAMYTPRPSEFVTSPSSPLYQGNEEIVDTELDYLIDTRNPKGVWDITWTWFDLGQQYVKEFAVSENWWKAFKAIEKVNFLKNFGRIREIK